MEQTDDTSNRISGTVFYFVKAVKNKKITKNSVVTKTVKNLKSKKVYYVRVRTYTTIKYNGEQMNLHSDWSKVKKVTVK